VEQKFSTFFVVGIHCLRYFYKDKWFPNLLLFIFTKTGQDFQSTIITRKSLRFDLREDEQSKKVICLNGNEWDLWWAAKKSLKLILHSPKTCLESRGPWCLITVSFFFKTHTLLVFVKFFSCCLKFLKNNAFSNFCRLFSFAVYLSLGSIKLSWTYFPCLNFDFNAFEDKVLFQGKITS